MGFDLGLDKNISAVVDMRFDQPGDLTLTGLEVNSFEAVKLFVDKLKSIGYTSVTFATNVPINIDTGEIVKFDPTPGQSNAQKTEPKDLWALCSYAGSIGLDVAIKLDIVEYRTDSIIGFWTPFGTNFSLPTFFKSVLEYEKQLAVKAEYAGVDTFYVGNFSNGLDTAEFRTQWQDIINQIRSVYSGKLAYTSNSNRLDNPAVIWEMVDVIGLAFSPNISKDPIYELKQIINKYYNSDSGVVDEIGQIRKYDSYKKEIILDTIEITAANIGWQSDPFWNLLLNNQLSAKAFNIDYEFQSIRFQSIFYLLENDLSKYVTGANFREYMPWHEATWIEKPVDKAGEMWTLAKELGFSLYDNQFAESVLRTYLKYDFIPLVDGPTAKLNALGGIDNGQLTYDDLWVLFSNPIKSKSGEIYLLDSKNKVIEKFSVNSEKVTIVNNALIVNPTKDLSYNSTYRLKINSGLVEDPQGNSNNQEVFEFTTTDTIITRAQNFNLTGINRKVSYFGEKNFTGIGSKFGDSISAGFGNDKLNGGLGNDTLTGGAGNDTFVFNTKQGANNIDTITDFSAGDKIALSKSIFKAFGKDKTVATDKLVYGDKAIDTNDFIIYDQATGKLYYDADGLGSKSQAIQIALIGTDTHSTLTAADFTII